MTLIAPRQYKFLHVINEVVEIPNTENLILACDSRINKFRGCSFHGTLGGVL